MLAGMYIGIAVVLMVSTAGPFAAAGDPAVKLISGAVFGVALTLVVFAGAELVTSAMMILTQGAVTRHIPVAKAVGTLLFCFAGNLAGSMVFGWLVVRSGVLHSNAAAGEMLTGMLEAKAQEGVGELFFRGVLCNILVCLAIWASNRLRSEAGKAIIIFWCLLAFIASGFEHVVANMTTFSIGVFSPEALTNWGEFGRNMLWVGLGNLVGGAVVVGIGYLVASGWFHSSRLAGGEHDGATPGQRDGAAPVEHDGVAAGGAPTLPARTSIPAIVTPQRVRLDLVPLTVPELDVTAHTLVAPPSRVAVQQPRDGGRLPESVVKPSLSQQPLPAPGEVHAVGRECGDPLPRDGRVQQPVAWD